MKTPVNMANLGRMDKGIDDCDNAIEEIYAKRVNNVVTTNEDTFLAGPVGKVLQDQVTELNKNMGDLKVVKVDEASTLPDNPSEKFEPEKPYLIIKTGGAGMYIGYEANPTYGIQLNFNYFIGVRYRIKSGSTAFGEWVALK